MGKGCCVQELSSFENTNFDAFFSEGDGKGKDHLRTGHEGPKGSRDTTLLFP
jgi:hypothetical protein